MTPLSDIILTPSQAAALDLLQRFAKGATPHSMAVLDGWAGTGKTTVVGRLLADLVASGYGPIAVAAPTNKAVRVLRDKIAQAGLPMTAEPLDPMQARQDPQAPVSFGSIHSLLGLQLVELEDGSQECKSARDSQLHAFDLVVVDECSMLGDDLFRRISVAKRQTLVLFVGDSAQLPPIQPGEAISPTFSQVQLRVTLSEVVRQAADNPIIALSVAIRQAIEESRRVGTGDLTRTLPPLPAAAGLVAGDAQTAIAIALFEIAAGRDARIVAFTNQAVLNYNAAIHLALHGRTATPFVIGERVIVHAQCEGRPCEPADDPDGSWIETGTKITLITSEECDVRHLEARTHPTQPNIPATYYVLARDDGSTVGVYVAERQADLDREIGERWSEWRDLKAQENDARQCGRHREAGELKDRGLSHSKRTWALKRAFASIRHAYAITAHKSQGSTFDTAVVDLADLAKMRSAFAFNRALYVAATRASTHLAIVA